MSFKRGLLKAPGGGTKTHRARFPRSRQPGALGQPPPPASASAHPPALPTAGADHRVGGTPSPSLQTGPQGGDAGLGSCPPEEAQPEAPKSPNIA